MHQALLEAQSKGVALLTVVESIMGESLPEEFHRQYQEQQRFASSILHGVQFVDKERLQPLIVAEKIAPLLQQYLPLPICRQFRCLPVQQLEDAGALLVVMVNPSDEEACNLISKQLAHHQLKLKRRGVFEPDYDTILDDLYQDYAIVETLKGKAQKETAQTSRHQSTVVDVTEVMDEFPVSEAPQSTNRFPPQTPPSSPDISAEEMAEVAPLVNKILILGLRQEASEIHLTPQENQFLVHIRQGNTLRPLFEPMSPNVAPAVVRRLKELSDLDVNQRQVPQKGRLRKSYNGRPVYFFIHTLPSFLGEKVLVRIVPGIETLPRFTDTANEAEQQALSTLVQAGSGLYVFAGAAYAGKSTTLEAFLKQQLKRNVTLGSVESPIRHGHQRITQLEVDPAAPQGFPQAISALCEQSTDVIAVDSVTDAETAQALIQPLQEGRLVFITMTAKDAAAAIAQLQQWLSPQFLTEYLQGVVAQRLIRRICPACRLPQPLTPEQQKQYRLSNHTIFSANTISEEMLNQASVKQRVCQQCGGVGYAGITGVYEVVPITEALQPLLNRPCAAADLRVALQLLRNGSPRKSSNSQGQPGSDIARRSEASIPPICPATCGIAET